MYLITASFPKNSQSPVPYRRPLAVPYRHPLAVPYNAPPCNSENFKEICQFLSVIPNPVGTRNIPFIKKSRNPISHRLFCTFEDFYYDSYLENNQVKKFKFEKLVKNFTGGLYKVQSIFWALYDISYVPKNYQDLVFYKPSLPEPYGHLLSVPYNAPPLFFETDKLYLRPEIKIKSNLENNLSIFAFINLMVA